MKRYRVSDGDRFRLAEWDPAATSGIDGKAAGRAELADLTSRLDDLQDLLYADGRHRLLVVLQGMDTAGKGGAIRRVFRGMNPAGVRVTSFKAPTGPELAHDFLWRVHPHVPGDGEVALFDRSHYEDVLIVRVHGLVPPKRWAARYRHIREFEQMLVDEGVTIRKFFLHISEQEQRRRLEARLTTPSKRWKFRIEDVEERDRWGDYQTAYEEAIRRTSTREAPWYVVPADHKWHRDLVICRTLVDTLEGLDLRYPDPGDDLDGVMVT